MKRLFQNYTKFNEPLNEWDVTKVTNMELMFHIQ
jgi:surface protein